MVVNNESTLQDIYIELQDALKDLAELKYFITHDEIIKPNILNTFTELGQYLAQKVLKRRQSK